MAISGLETINIGVQNESANSDSLYTAFNKIQNNFAILSNDASQYATFTAGNGISTSQDANTGNVVITNIGVTSLTAGSNNVSLTSSNGAITIAVSGGGGNGSGTVTSVAIVGGGGNARIVPSGGPIVTAGTISVDLAASGVTAGTYTYPTLTVDTYGRVTVAANGNSVGTVTSVGVTPGSGIQVTGSPVTTSGNITIVNTGVTRLTAGSGILLSGSNGNVTVSANTSSGTVTSVGLSSSTLSVSGSPVISAGVISVNLLANTTVSGSVTTGRVLLNASENLADGAAANLLVTASYFTTTGASTATLAAGTDGLVKTFMMVADGGDMVITVSNAGWKSSGTGTMTFNDIGDSCTLQYINSKWYCVGNNGVAFA